jgi:hypothetical protein
MARFLRACIGVSVEYERAKAMNLELRSRIVLAEGEVLPVSIFDEAVEGFGFGADTSKLHKRIMEKRDEFRFRDLSQRAATLPSLTTGGWPSTRTRTTRFRSLSSAACPSPASFFNDSHRSELS